MTAVVRRTCEDHWVYGLFGVIRNFLSFFTELANPDRWLWGRASAGNGQDILQEHWWYLPWSETYHRARNLLSSDHIHNQL